MRSFGAIDACCATGLLVVSVLVGGALAGGCGSPETMVVEPASGSLAGYYPVRLDLADTEVVAADVQRVTVGGVATYDQRADGRDALTVMVQGAPGAGPALVELHTADGVVPFPDAFRYEPPLDPQFRTFAAMGASLTQGVQGGVPTHHGALASPPHRLAEQLGAYMPLPLLVPDLFPTIDADDIGPPPACEVPDVVAHVTAAAVDVIAKLNDEEQDRIGFYLARVDPDITVHDVAVGDTNTHDLIHGPPDDEFSQEFLTKLVYEPYADIIDPVASSQLELVEALQPTLVISTDAFGNDLIGSIVLSDDIDPERLTPVDEMERDLTELLDRLVATGAQVYIANMPRPTLLPVTAERRAHAIDTAVANARSAGEDEAAAEAAETAAVDARIAEVEAAAEAYNAILDALADELPTVHVVDFHGAVADIERDGLWIGDTELTVGKLGGLLSTDGVHFSDVGYAMVANLFVDRINETLGTGVPRIDLAEILPGDPYAPAAYLAIGLDPSECD